LPKRHQPSLLRIAAPQSCAVSAKMVRHAVMAEQGTNANAAVVAEHVGKQYGAGAQAVAAIDDVSLCVRQGESVSIMGPSGCGKSTLLNLIAGLDTPDRGRVVVAGHDLSRLSDNARSHLRLHHIGFVFQSFHLLPTFTVEENVVWPLELQGMKGRAARDRARAALRHTGLPDAALPRRPAELSGGEQQRVAIARALATEPLLLLADEPTGNLDTRTGEAVLTLLRELNAARGLTVIMVTHNTYAAMYGDRTIELRDGRIVSDVSTPQAARHVIPLRG
jgi:putative ABC transport system ATP-binding protein